MQGIYPDETFEFVLPGHARLASPPRFRARYLRAREMVRLRARADELAKIEAADPAQTIEGLVELLSQAITSWTLDFPCDRAGFDRLPDVLTYHDLWSLWFSSQAAQYATKEELGKSASPSDSAAAGGAPAAARVDPEPSPAPRQPAA